MSLLAAGTALRASRALAAVEEDVDLADAIGDGLTLEDWLRAGATLVGFVVVGRLLRLVVERLVDRSEADNQVARMLGRFAQNVLALVGFVYALNLLDVQVGPLLGALGVGGIAIAIAATAILQNVFASLMLKIRHPIRVGDEIWTQDRTGRVREVNFRAVVMDSFDGERVVIPSSVVMNDVIVNHTARSTRRTVLPVGVAYDTDLRRAQEIAVAATSVVDGVLDSPAPQAWVTAFSESSIDFDVRFWHASDIATTFRVRSDVAMSLKAAFDREGIEIPFPQRVVTLVPDDRDPQA